MDVALVVVLEVVLPYRMEGISALSEPFLAASPLILPHWSR